MTIVPVARLQELERIAAQAQDDGEARRAREIYIEAWRNRSKSE